MGAVLAPPLLGSADTTIVSSGAAAQTQEIIEPIIIQTPEQDVIRLEPTEDGSAALWLRGTGEPGAFIELHVNNDSTMRVLPVQRDGSWFARIVEDELSEGEISLSVCYAGEKHSEALTWRSRYIQSAPRLKVPAYIAVGTRSVRGSVVGDAELTATVDGVQFPCLLTLDGKFVVPGTVDLPVGAEIVLLATDAFGNTTRAICMVAKADAAVLLQALDAVQVALYADPATPEPTIVTLPPTPSPLPQSTVTPIPPADASPGATEPAPQTEKPAIQDQPETSDQPETQDQPETPAEPFFPENAQPRVRTIEAYATLEGLTLPEINDSLVSKPFSADVRKRLRDMRRQMVLPLDLAAVGADGLETPLMARGYRVGSVWVDPAVQIDTQTGAQTEGFAFSLDLTCGELMGEPRLQVVAAPDQLDALKAQGWVPLDDGDDTFFTFDDFVPVQGLALVYVSVPLRFDAAPLQLFYRDSSNLGLWKQLLLRASERVLLAK
jgi:hypothetical protein